MHKKLNSYNNCKSLIVFTIFISLFSIYNVSYSQGRRDLDKFKGYVYNPFDTSKLSGRDTTKLSAEDSLRRIPVDSNSRIKYFKYIRPYIYGTPLKEKIYPILLDNATQIKTEIKFDSLDNVVIQQSFEGEDIKAPLVIPLNKYIDALAKYNERNIFNGLFSDKFKGITADDLSRLFEKFTDITIPLPFKSETIFGPNTFNLRINGAIDLTASYQNVKSEQQVVSLSSSTQNNINFKQEVQVTAKGTIGDKLTVDADWNTQRVFDFENQLKIKYTGYADEVIQKIEAGNVSLETKSSLIQSTQALFGIKGEFKLGPLYISSVISQKKSKQETKDYVGGAQQQDFQLNVWDYSDSHYFIDTIYKKSFLAVYNDSTGQLPDSVYNNKVLSDDPSFQVWLQCNETEAKKRHAVLSVLLPQKVTGQNYDTVYTNTSSITGKRYYGYFRKLNSSEYSVDPFAGYVSLKITVPDNYYVGVSYKTLSGKKFGLNEYDVAPDANLILTMIKCDNPSLEATPVAWELKLKNIYRLPISKVIQDGFKLDVVFNNNNVMQPNLPSQQTSLNQVLKIDRFTGVTRRGPPDGIFDYLPGRTINTETGDIIFPTLKPFFDEIILSGADTTFKYAEIYSKRKNESQTSINASKYFIKGSAKGEAGISSSINLGLNVVQGSVKLLLGSTPLVENVDYSVDYSTGIVVVRNATALTSKDLKITYETNDLFTLASKTLFGVRADYKVSEKTGFGFTFVNLRQETLNDKVRIGEEPTNNSILGLDFTTEAKPKFLTKLVNLLPGYNTKEESAVTFKGEFAYIMPDPNTKKSLIPQDNNEAIAYVDDMEGAKKIISLGMNYSTWSISSLPVDTINSNGEHKLDQSKRARMRWYNVPNDVEIKKVYPLRDIQPGQDRMTPLIFSFDPASRGTYNYNYTHWDTTTRVTNWNGVMKYLNTTSTDLLNENISYIEFNMKIANDSNNILSNAKLFIDLGRIISEDAIPNGVLNTEDSNKNGILEISEDIGLDGMTNQQELNYLNFVNNSNYSLDSIPDPALDDNNTTGTIDYGVINGTEGNRLYEGGNKPDTEDLNHNGAPDFNNEYFEYEISLDTTNNRRISGRGAPGSGWFQYRIPLSEFTKNINSATLTNIQFARVWIKGVEKKIALSFIDFNLVGNQWYKPNKNDTTYNVSVVSIEENSQIYQSPVPGDILRQTVRNTSGVNTKSNEQSLAMQVNNLSVGQGKIAIKEYRTQTLDLFNYKVMKLFVNGDPSFNYTNENIYDANMVVRFGSDSSNFYEYRAPIHPDVRPGTPWNPLNEVSINFADLTSLKFSRDSVNQVIDMKVPNGPPGAYYRIKGAPALNIIREFVVGVEKNRSGPNTTITGSVWFNEIRVLKVNDDNGYAFNFNTGVKLADFANVTLNISKVDPNFHSIDTRVGSRNTGQSWDINASVNAHKFVNNLLASLISNEWKDFLNLPITYRHSENIVKPKYYPGTDIDIDKAAAEKYKQVLAKTNDEAQARLASDNLLKEAQTLIVRNDFGISGMSFKVPSNNYFVKTLVNAFSVNFNASFGSQRDITYERKTDFAYTGSLNFNTDFQLADKVNLKIGKILKLGDEYKNAKIYLFIPLLPFAPLYSSNFTASTDFNRTQNESKQRRYLADDPTGRQFRANRGFGFNWKFIEDWIVDLSGNYSVRIGSDLTPLETYNDSLRSQRPDKEIFKDIFLNGGLVNFGKDLDYTQSAAFNPKFNLPIIKKFMELTANYSVTYGWMNPNTTTNIGYNVGYSNSWNSQINFKLGEVLGLFKGSGPPNKLINTVGGNNNTNSTKHFRLFSDDKPGLGDVIKILGTLIPENMNLTFNQTNQVANPGVNGRPGFGNFWLMPTTKENLGPSRMYQLGLSMDAGLRAPNVILTDQFNQTNNVTITATINPIFPQEIRMNLTFKRQWGFNNSATYQTNEIGLLGNPTNKSSNSNLGYSMFFAGDIDKFTFENSSDPDQNTRNISSAFKKSIGSIPFPNWTLSISGLEKFPLFDQFASTVTFENNFTSEYSEASSVDIRGIDLPSRQAVTQAFNPLIGLNVTFKPTLGGNLTAAFRLNKSKTNSLAPSSNLIQTTSTLDWSLNANFAKAGFEIPLFGLALKNDISFALTISKNTNDPLDYRYIPGSEVEKLPGSGSTVTTFNPSIQYSLSSKVQMQLFYKYIKTEPTQNTASTVPRTSNEGGLNIRISIQ